jgi:transposase
MPRKRSATPPPYAPEFRAQLIALVRAGRTPEEVSREFEPSGQTIRNWVRKADRDAGARADGLTSAERAELTELRRENRRLKVEREILSKRRSGSHGRPARFRAVRAVLRVREGSPGRVPGRDDVSRPRSFSQRVLCVGDARVERARGPRCAVDGRRFWRVTRARTGRTGRRRFFGICATRARGSDRNASRA